jgi:hypothetical protein
MEARTTGAALPAPGAAPVLNFKIEDAGVLEYAAGPTLRFALAIESQGGPVRSVALDIRVRIAATRRAYDARAQARLVELFGHPDQWGRSLRSLHWANVSLHVPGFRASTVVDLPLPCTYDFELTVSKYFHALEDGEVPLEFLFGGTVFYAAPDGRLQIGRIGWDKDAEFRLPVTVWDEMMDRYFPNSAWLRLQRDCFDRLYAHKARGGFLTWEHAIDALLPGPGAGD